MMSAMIPIVLLLVRISSCAGERLSSSANLCTSSRVEGCNHLVPAGESLLQTRSERLLRPVGVEHGSPMQHAKRLSLLPAAFSHKSSKGSARKKSTTASGIWDGTQLFYHFHMPRTGGTSVANLLFADMCRPLDSQFKLLTWSSACTESCEMGLTDNEFSCYNDASPQRVQILHSEFSAHQKRAEEVRVKSGAKQIVYVTTLRRGSDRLVSQWLKELFHGSWAPPHGVPPDGNDSLQLYIKENAGHHWQEAKSASQRNNLQVASLASVPTSSNGEAARSVNLMDLEYAMHTLSTGRWVIGFTDCMEQLHEKLEDIASQMQNITHKPMFSVDHEASEGHSLFDLNTLSQETRDLLSFETALDDELYAWAWKEAMKKEDPRWAGTC